MNKSFEALKLGLDVEIPEREYSSLVFDAEVEAMNILFEATELAWKGLYMEKYGEVKLFYDVKDEIEEMGVHIDPESLAYLSVLYRGENRVMEIRNNLVWSDSPSWVGIPSEPIVNPKQDWEFIINEALENNSPKLMFLLKARDRIVEQNRLEEKAREQLRLEARKRRLAQELGID